MNHIHKCKFCGTVYTTNRKKSNFCPKKCCNKKFKYWAKNNLFRLIINDENIKEFRDIKGYESIYKIDTDGNILYLKKKVYIKQSYTLGYLSVTLCKDGIRSRKYVHRLIAETYIPNPYNKPQVNHKDGNKENNHIDNLEWATAKENIHHSYRIGTSKVGEKRHDSSLTDKQVLEIRRRHIYGFKQSEISKIMNVNRSIVFSIIHDKAYKTVK